MKDLAIGAILLRSLRVESIPQGTSEKCMPLRSEESLGALTDASLSLSSITMTCNSEFGTVDVVTVVLGKDGRWKEMGIVDALHLGRTIVGLARSQAE